MSASDFSLNPVAEIVGTYNGQPDDQVSDYQRRSTGATARTWDTNTVAGVRRHQRRGRASSWSRGSHIYKQQGTYDVTVYVTGPDGQTVSDDTATVTASPMPDAASEPIRTDRRINRGRSRSPTSLRASGCYADHLVRRRRIQPQPGRRDRRHLQRPARRQRLRLPVQINWGDDASWDTDTRSSPAALTAAGFVLVKGSSYLQAAGHVRRRGLRHRPRRPDDLGPYGDGDGLPDARRRLPTHPSRPRIPGPKPLAYESLEPPGRHADLARTSASDSPQPGRRDRGHVQRPG